MVVKLTEEQQIGMINDLEDNLCTSTLAAIARVQTTENAKLQSALDAANKKLERIRALCHDKTEILPAITIDILRILDEVT